MKDLKLIEGSIPKGFRSDGPGWLFNTLTHRQLQDEKNWISYHLVDAAKKRSMASMHFHIDGETAASPHQAPFGSLERSEKLSAADIFEFLRQIELQLQKKGVRRIHIKNPPQAYLPKTYGVTEVILLNLGYRIVHAEINASIAVDTVAFEKKIESWELRKLKQGRKAGIKFREVTISSLDEVYAFLLACREERHQSLSMDLAALKRTVSACKGTFSIFGVYRKNELLAASIGVRINGSIFYNFYSGHPHKYDSLSPVVSLMAGMYEWCYENDVALLDLGTSALEDLPNFGLLEFKLRLGGTPSSKFTFEKELR